MKVGSIHLALFLLLVCNVNADFSIRSILTFFKSVTYKSMYAVKCQFTICCNDEWIISNLEGLENDLKSKVHGQHLVQKTVVGHIKGHLRTSDPSKALVLSFHGPTGVGKNFVSRIIAENLYKNGLDSKFVHLISATKEFPHAGMVPFYKEKLKTWIEGNITRCEQSMFIFDEIDKMPSLLLDIIKPYLDYYQHLAGVKYRRAIFIFLSNTGSTMISQKMLEHWKSGKKREQMELRDIEHDIMLSAINDKNQNGLWHSQVISNHLVTAFIPFLPLERVHIRSCIKDSMLALRYYNHIRAIPEDIVSKVIDELMFFPEVEQIFSSTGCKRVSEKVGLVMMSSAFKDEL